MMTNPNGRNMPLWVTAPIILRDMIRRHWLPHFELFDSSGIVVFSVFSCEPELVLLVPPEDRDEFCALISRAKARLLDAVGFHLDDYLFHPITDAFLSSMESDLSSLIHSYESSGGGDVRARFYCSVLYSDWDSALFVDVLGLE